MIGIFHSKNIYLGYLIGQVYILNIIQESSYYAYNTKWISELSIIIIVVYT